jgi:hypothetical protein
MDSDVLHAWLVNLLTSKYGPEAGDMLSGQHPCLVNEQQPTDICLKGQSICFKKSSVADPECLSRILDPGSWIPDPNFCHPGSEFFPPQIPDPEPQH